MAGQQQKKNLINPPRFEGEIRLTNNPWGVKGNIYWKHNGNEWEEVAAWGVGKNYDSIVDEYKSQTEQRDAANLKDNLSVSKSKVEGRIRRPQLPDSNFKKAKLQYPAGNTINEFSDYVLFEFKRYSPPFKQMDMFTNDISGAKKGDASTKARTLNLKQAEGKRLKNLFAWKEGSYDYNQSASYKDANPDDFPAIVMYMPEDVSTGFRGNWGGKAFSTVGAGILGAAGQAGLENKLGKGFGTIGSMTERALGITSANLLKKVVKTVGGDQLDNNDIFGSISGAIMNPNTELLFQSVDMRNFMLKFKLVPRNSLEGGDINRIVKVFKACTLPLRNPGKVMGYNDPKRGINDGVIDAFIGVPNLCKVSFMTGSQEHPVLPRYKMLAITQVDVNYTPDGAYATYTDGQPVAIELSINFQETKINFAEEIINDAIR